MPSIERLSFVIPVRNDAVGLERCLRSIAVAARGRGCQVIVVDNGSIDGSAERARSAGVTVVNAEGRVARLRNVGAKAADGTLIAFVDADHEINAEWVDAALEVFEDRTVGAVGAPYHPPATANWVQRSYNLLRDHRPGVRDAAWLGSGNLIVRRESFATVGGFDETLETCEDVDLCQRVRRAGGRVLADSRLRSTHHGDPQTLRRLFVSELWRGRDNLRVSFREPALRELPSVLIPVFDLLVAVGAVAAVGLWGGRPGLVAALAGATLVIGLSLIRACRMAGRLEHPTLAAVAQAAPVAILYDAARALALVVRVPHRRTGGPLSNA